MVDDVNNIQHRYNNLHTAIIIIFKSINLIQSSLIPVFFFLFFLIEKTLRKHSTPPEKKNTFHSMSINYYHYQSYLIK